MKTAAQMLAELEAIYRGGYRGHLDFVDDNFIGNKKAVKAFLPELIAWQKEHDYPFAFSTEASLNLADDDELLALMREAGFFVVFVGIESSDGDTLVAARKKQNAHRNLTESIHKIYRAGMFVIAGFIVGFDSEKGSIADGMVDCIEDADIAICMAGLRGFGEYAAHDQAHAGGPPVSRDMADGEVRTRAVAINACSG